MKILQLTTHLNRGGITSYLYNLSRALLERGHLVFAASSGGSLVSEFEKAGIKHIPLPINTKSELSPKLWRSAARLKKIISQEKIQIIHTHTRVTHCVGWQLSRKTGVHHLATAHGYYKLRWGRKIFPAWGEKTVAISPAVKEHLLNDFKLQEKKVKVVFTGVDLEKFSPGVNPVRELRFLTSCADGGFKPPSTSSDDDRRLKSVAFSNGVNRKQVR